MEGKNLRILGDWHAGNLRLGVWTLLEKQPWRVPVFCAPARDALQARASWNARKWLILGMFCLLFFNQCLRPPREGLNYPTPPHLLADLAPAIGQHLWQKQPGDHEHQKHMCPQICLFAGYSSDITKTSATAGARKRGSNRTRQWAWSQGRCFTKVFWHYKNEKA